ncbi:hypothetical protein Vau01_005370 [Virgisporangium aurantiacum]|uniref:Uncharacterized protein n=1 Tax=Virgisporangium aurantiacum TaxID=175570 RepID=A0A8J4DWZ8_9ACTN|nr:hypothetical protein Vau01_005370 [Virgisporangium aurantiacum]
MSGPANSGEPGLEGESTTVLRPGNGAGNDNEPTQAVSGEEPTASVEQPDEEGQRTQVIRPGNQGNQTNQNDQPTERWH